MSPSRTQLAAFAALAISLVSVGPAAAAGFLTSPTYPTGMTPSLVAAADFNRDGHCDVATTSLALNNVSVLLNNGNGTFGSPTNYPAGGSPIIFITSADVAIAQQYAYIEARQNRQV
jgi:hypothetical protein